MKNFMSFLGGGLTHGLQFKGADQRGNEALFRCRANREAMSTGGPYTPCAAEDYRDLEVIRKRKDRGGSNFVPTDAW